jgi:hydrogenase expression/formation protein HypE
MSEKIVMAHGGGGRLSGQLIEDEILSRFGDGPLRGLPDAALLDIGGPGIIYSTDSFVVNPVEFPGGDIGKLAVYGTVNDISAGGGKPLFLSLALILEEGLELSLLRRILDSVKSAADECGVKVVTGDTKVVSAGHCDKIYINTSGLGLFLPGFHLGRERVTSGDDVIVSGPVGDHGFAVLTARENISMPRGPVSDCAPVHRLTEAASEYADSVKFMRDPTRGGIAAVLNEIVQGTKHGIILEENAVPVSEKSRAVSDILGLEPLISPCEGRIILIADPSVSEKILDRWRKMPEGAEARGIGRVNDDPGRVSLRTLTGAERIVDVPSGELLPRIC